MTDQGDPLARIADALERLAPPPATTDWIDFPAYVWDRNGARGIDRLDAPSLALLRGIDRQKELVIDNVARLAAGYAAHDMLLWGSRGMGKSALVRGAILAAQSQRPGSIALVQADTEALPSLSALFADLARQDRSFLIFIDDLGFEQHDSISPRHLRSWLQGGVEARPPNIRLAVTSNRRAIVARDINEQNDPLNPRDAVDDQLALADRFGLSIGFHNCDQPAYLTIIAGYAEAFGLQWDEAEALEWARRRGARSGRTAWQFITELAGRARKTL
jgi:predicted AAA+ superfamily ATPase